MLRCLAFLAMIALATAPLVASPPAPATAGETLVIENVTVIPMTKEGGVLPNRTVVIEGGRIVSIADAADAGGPPDANRIDGTGKWLVPGFSDMHVHIGNERMLRLLARSPVPEDGTANMQDAFTPYIVNGVLQVFDLAAMP